MRIFDIEKTSLNDFNASAKDILEAFYLMPYPEKEEREYQKPPAKVNIRDNQIEREVHGAMHASRVAAYVDHFHALHTKYDEKIETNVNLLAVSFNTTPKTLLTLIKYAALFHDSARQGEGEDHWDSQSAENGRRYLVKKGVPEKLAKFVAIAAANKGNTQKDQITFNQEITLLNKTQKLNVDAKQADYLRRLIGDSDCLEIIRCRKKFKPNFMHFYQKYQNNANAMIDLASSCRMAGEVIYLQHDAIHRCILDTDNKFMNAFLPNGVLVPASSYDNDSKLQYEHADNPYSKTTEMLVNNEFYVKLKPFVENKSFTTKTTPPLTPADLHYNPFVLFGMFLFLDIARSFHRKPFITTGILFVMHAIVTASLGTPLTLTTLACLLGANIMACLVARMFYEVFYDIKANDLTSRFREPTQNQHDTLPSHKVLRFSLNKKDKAHPLRDNHSKYRCSLRL